VSGGDDIVVQVVKDPLGGKGARLTTFISLPSRYLVFMPRSAGIGISARIEDETERTRLREIVQQMVREGHPGGYIGSHRRRRCRCRALAGRPRIPRTSLAARA
jgi:ribonuclease G